MIDKFIQEIERIRSRKNIDDRTYCNRDLIENKLRALTAETAYKYTIYMAKIGKFIWDYACQREAEISGKIKIKTANRETEYLDSSFFDNTIKIITDLSKNSPGYLPIIIEELKRTKSGIRQSAISAFSHVNNIDMAVSYLIEFILSSISEIEKSLGARGTVDFSNPFKFWINSFNWAMEEYFFLKGIELPNEELECMWEEFKERLILNLEWLA